jgi:hypothetical protein
MQVLSQVGGAEWDGCTLTRLVLCEQVFQEDGGPDLMMLACGQRARRRFLPDVT